MKIGNKTILTTALVVAGLAQAASAQGLLLQETGYADQVVNLTGNTAFYSANFGDYSLVFTGGIIHSGGMLPVMDLDVIATTASANAGTLHILFSGGTFGPTLGNFLLTTAVGPFTSGTISTSVYESANPWGTTTELTPAGGVSDPAGATTTSWGVVSGGSYYLTIEDVINGNVSSADSTLSVLPEPSTIVAAALMLLPLGIGSVRSLRKGGFNA
jgi:hypothetical protein